MTHMKFDIAAFRKRVAEKQMARAKKNDAFYDWLAASAYDHIMESLATEDYRSGMAEFNLDMPYHDLMDDRFRFDGSKSTDAVKQKLTDTGFTDVEVVIRFDDADLYFYVDYYVQ